MRITIEIEQPPALAYDVPPSRRLHEAEQLLKAVYAAGCPGSRVAELRCFYCMSSESDGSGFIQHSGSCLWLRITDWKNKYFAGVNLIREQT